MRSGDIRHLEQFPVDVRLVVPRIDDNGPEFWDGIHEGVLVYDLPSCSIYEKSPRAHHRKESCIGHPARGIVQRSMYCDYI